MRSTLIARSMPVALLLSGRVRQRTPGGSGLEDLVVRGRACAGCCPWAAVINRARARLIEA